MVIRKLGKILLAHGAAGHPARLRGRIEHCRRPETEFLVVVEERAGLSGQIAQSEVRRRILNRKRTGVELTRRLEHREAEEAT